MTMSDLFMDLHHRSHRWHSHENTTPTPTSASASASAITATTTSDSPSSTQRVNDHILSHHNEKCTTDQAVAGHNANYKFYNRKVSKDDTQDGDIDDDVFDNTLSLKLRKPKHWKWELSTSKSCSNIALPRILLYDHKGQLLVDAQGDIEKVYKQEDHERTTSYKSTKRAHPSKQQQPEYRQRAATTNLTHSIRKALENEFNGLHIQEATPSPDRNYPSPISSHHSRKAIDVNTTDLPDYGLSRRSSSLRGVRFNVEDNQAQLFNESHIPEFLPTPPSTTTPTTSSSSGPRQKRKYRRSQSSSRSSAHSESILERFSRQKGRFSSPEFSDDNDVKHNPRYFLRSCNAGTLVVKEDSFNLHPRRRRRHPKNRSTESLQRVQEIPLSFLSSPQMQSIAKSPTPSYSIRNRKQKLIYSPLIDGNILLNKQSPTSEEDFDVNVDQMRIVDNDHTRHLHKYRQASCQSKDSTYPNDIHQNGKVR